MLNIPFFPTYDGSQGRISFSPYSFFFKENEKERDLDYETVENNTLLLKDKRAIWNVDDYPFYISREIHIANADRLYGQEGIACSDATIGVAIKWSSKDSNRRDVFDLGEIVNTKEEQRLKIEKGVLNGLRGKVELTTIIYLKKNGIPQNGEAHLANIPGTILGELDTTNICLDGSGSIFPIFVTSIPGGPLWDVTCNWEDASVDSFEETVSIVFNSNHRNYRYINRNDKKFNSQLLIEILASALTLVIEKMREDDKDFSSFTYCSEGSVAAAIRYFQDKLDVDLGTPLKSSKSLRLLLEKRFTL